MDGKNAQPWLSIALLISRELRVAGAFRQAASVDLGTPALDKGGKIRLVVKEIQQSV